MRALKQRTMWHAERHTVAVRREVLPDLVRRLRSVCVLCAGDGREVPGRVGIGAEGDGVVRLDRQLVILDRLTLLERRVQVEAPVLRHRCPRRSRSQRSMNTRCTVQSREWTYLSNVDRRDLPFLQQLRAVQ